MFSREEDEYIIYLFSKFLHNKISEISKAFIQKFPIYDSTNELILYKMMKNRYITINKANVKRQASNDAIVNEYKHHKVDHHASNRY